MIELLRQRGRAEPLKSAVEDTDGTGTPSPDPATDQLFLAIGINNVRGRDRTRRVHAHVERTVAHDAETTFGVFQLSRRNPDIEKRATDRPDPKLIENLVRVPKIRLPQREPATHLRQLLARGAKGGARENTTIALVVTDATLTKAQAKRLAIVAHDGLARAIYPVHTPLDGDLVFAVATGRKPLGDPFIAMAELGAIAANTLARAIARAVYEAGPLPFPGAQPSWRQKFGK